MAGMTSASSLDADRAQENFSRLMVHVAKLYCMGGSSSISSHEAQGLATSVAYVLGIADATVEEATCVLDVEDSIALWHEGLHALDVRVDAALDMWREIIAAMPPIRNVALRDTLESLGELRRLYDTRFAAHEVPCDIDYQLSKPVARNSWAWTTSKRGSPSCSWRRAGSRSSMWRTASSYSSAHARTTKACT